MYAYLMDRPGSIFRGEVPDPSCGRDEILLHTEAVSICSTDVSYFRSHLFPDQWPIIPGHEYVGTILEVGRDCPDGLRPGDRVCYWGQTDFGGMAEYRTIRPILPHGRAAETSWYTERNFYDADQAATVVLPADLDPTRATLIEPLTSVLRSLFANPPQPGDRCVVLGCGPSGQLALQALIHHFGARSVTVLDRNPDRIRLALSLGAVQGFDISTQAGELEHLVRESHDDFADYVFDALPYVQPGSAGPDIRELAMGLLRPGGTYVIYGASALRQEINMWLILAKGLRLRSVPFDVRRFPMSRSAHVAHVAAGMLTSGTVAVRPLVTDVVDLADEEAVRRAFTGYGLGASMKTSLVPGVPAVPNGSWRPHEVMA